MMQLWCSLVPMLSFLMTLPDKMRALQDVGFKISVAEQCEQKAKGYALLLQNVRTHQLQQQ